MNIIKKIIFLLVIPVLLQQATLYPTKGDLKADKIIVYKAKRQLQLIQKGKILKTYKIALGSHPVGHKLKEGDGKTPEGAYKIIAKNTWSQFYLSLKISYPNTDDCKQAKANKVNPGGDIMIHGLGKKFEFLGKIHTLYDWTQGCIAVTNKEIKEIFNAVKVGTPIIIHP